MTERPRPIGFQSGSQATWTDNRFKLVHNSGNTPPRSDNGDVPFAEYELYDLHADPGETANRADAHPDVVARMRAELERWQASCAVDARLGEDR